MVEVGFVLYIILALLFLIAILQYDIWKKSTDYAEYLEDSMQNMENSLNIVGEVLQRLPEMVPQFHMNQNPLSQILEFIQGVRTEDSNSNPQLRDDAGRYSDGTTKKEQGTTKEIYRD